MNTTDCILVTGGCGFIGCNFIRCILEQTDYRGRIVNVDALTYAGNPLSLTDLQERFPDRYTFVKADIRDRTAMAHVLDEQAVDTICHFAAESHVDRSIVAPDDFITTNIVGTFTLLELARQRSGRIRRFHHVSTDEVFGSLGDEGRFTETTPYHPNSPYSASKAGSDHLVRAYHATYGLPITISNCSNNYGPYQFPEKLVPLIILNALENRPLPVYGDGRNVRDWLYVEDHCHAIWKILGTGTAGRTYAVGGDSEERNLNLVRQICSLLDDMVAPPAGRSSHAENIVFVKDRPGHDFRYAIDSGRIRDELGWTPRESLQSGLRRTVRWYLDNRRWVEQVRSGDYQRWIARQYGAGSAVGATPHLQPAPTPSDH